MISIFTKTSFLCLLIFWSNCLVAQSSQPQNTTEKSTTKNSSYPASFFSQYSPQNAYDMVERLPGFTFDGGSDDRGFGGNAGNVLINNTRPSSKSSGLQGALNRIPASQVLYIEILRGGVSASDSAGHSVIANVIKKETETSGTWSFLTMRTIDGTVRPQLEGTLATKIDEWDTSFKGEIGGKPEYQESVIKNFDETDMISSNRNETLEVLEEYINFDGEGVRQIGKGYLTINGSVGGDITQEDITRTIDHSPISFKSVTEELNVINDEEKVINYELGLDWVSPIKDWKLHLITLASLQDTDSQSDNVYYNPDLSINETKLFTQETKETEYIFHMSFTPPSQGALQPEYGFEVANNKLQSDNELIENGEVSEIEGVDSVEEIRGEVFANFVYQYSPVVSIEGEVAVEYSKIKSISDITNIQRFTFFKPRLALNYKLDKKSSLVFEISHDVEQLDFNDFAASSDSGDDIITSGNGDLEPEQVDRLSVSYDLHFGKRGGLSIETYYEKRMDIHEYIILPSGNPALGNAGDANVWGIDTNINLPLDYVIEGGLLEIAQTYYNTDFYDPIISDNRHIDGYIPHTLDINFRQDITKYKFSWGMEYGSNYQEEFYYVDEKQVQVANHRLVSMFIETTRFFGMKTTFKIKDINTTRSHRTRYFYEEDRSGVYLGSEVADRKNEMQALLTFSGTY